MRMYGQVKGRRGKDTQRLYEPPKVRRCGSCRRLFDEDIYGVMANGKPYRLCPSCREYFRNRKQEGK